MISSISFIFGNLCFYHMHHTTMDFAQVLTFVLKKKKTFEKKTCTGQVVPFCSLAISTTMMKFICQEKKRLAGAARRYDLALCSRGIRSTQNMPQKSNQRKENKKKG